METTGSEFGVSSYLALVLVLGLPLGVNLWKLLGRGYLPAELGPHLLLDLSVVSLLILVMALDPLERPLVYGGLFLWFAGSFLLTHPPEGGWEWFGSLVALGIVGTFFPYLHHLTGPVTWGLLLAYCFVIRLWLPELSRGEVLEVLREGPPERIVAECLDTAVGYRRFAAGLEKLRFFLAPGAGYRERVQELEALHTSVRTELERQGIAFVDLSPWAGRVAPSSGAEGEGEVIQVDLPETLLEGRLLERDDDGVQLACKVRVGACQASLERLGDGSLRVRSLPGELQLDLEGTQP